MTFLPLPLAQVIGFLGLPTAAVTIYERSTSPRGDGFSSVTEVGTPHQLILQPLSGREVERMTEGRRKSAGLLIHSAQPLHVDNHMLYKQPGDAAPQRWLIVAASDWKDQGGFYEAVAVAI